MGWPAAPWSLAAAVRGSSTHVPVRSGAEELLASPLISRAEAAGIKVDDKIIAINNKEIHYFDEVTS